MEADPPSAASSASNITTRPLPRQQQQPELDDATTSQPPRSLERIYREARMRRSPPKGGKDGDRFRIRGGTGGSASGAARTRLWASATASATTKSLLPATERRPTEDFTAGQKAKKESQDDDKWELTPDGGSAGREGRQFAVANVGNNGRIYLRPTVRPAHQRYPQPQFVFPITPPSTAGLDALASEDQKDTRDDSVAVEDDQCSPLPVASTPTSPRREFLTEKLFKSRPMRRRALSDSTMPDTSVARESEPGGFKIVITQPGEEQRPRTVEDLDTSRPPLIQVSIPSWRIGTPRFSVRGTPFIRGSSYAPTEDVRSSNASLLNRSPQDLTPGQLRRPSPLPIAEMDVLDAAPSSPSSPVTLRPQPNAQPARATYLSTHLVITPAMFDRLTFKPACDDRAIVRYSTSGSVTAATPPRLVAEITSPSFLDYELLSDFFLTYRGFLEAADLLRMLFARLRWALARGDEAGMVVRVRTFVALRHWILNYFMDDFVIDYDLRVTFCGLLNDFVQELSQGDLKTRKVPLKILAELKKCWRRVCGQYWDGPDFDAALGPDVPVSPGGIAGHRDPHLDPTFWLQADAGPPQLDGLMVPTTPRDQTSFYADLSKAGHIDAVVAGDRPATPDNAVQDGPREQKGHVSPTSIASVDVVSCSFPTKGMRFAQPGPHHPLAAHPADPSNMHAASDPVATTPRALMGKRVRPHHTHKRNGSLSDSLREHASLTEKVLFKNAEFLLTLPYAGSLVRGNLLPPAQAFVEVASPDAPGALTRQTTLFQPPPTVELPKEKMAASAMSGQGMKKLLGSVRRALSTRGQVLSPTQGSFINISPLGPRGATTNRLPGTAIVPQAPRPRQNGTRPPVRIDLLGAEVAEDFKKAVREDAATDAERHGYLSPPATGSGHSSDVQEYLAADMDPSAFHLSPERQELRPTSDMGITTGSKSIVIVDDTVLPDGFPVMRGALPVVNSSVEAFAETFMPHMGDPTPPTTPPGRPMGTPRRSSYILGQHVGRTSLSAEPPLPPFIPDMTNLGSSERPSEESVRPSLDLFRQDRSRPPLSGMRGHSRNPSSRSYMSYRSNQPRRRVASFTSGMAPQPTVRSFDATTYSGASIDGGSQVLVPQPLRVLRRRPGGDLRAVANVGDLEPGTLRRSQSVGSFTTYSDSLHSSYLLRSPGQDSSGFVNVVSSDYSQRREETFSLGVIAEQNPKRNLSLFSTHSSKPVMRPSFEAEAQKLAQIPDDLDDDGGVESALLKLEGKYERKVGAKLSMDLRGVSPRISVSAEPTGDSHDAVTKEEKREHREALIGEDPHSPHMPMTAPTTLSVPGTLLDVSSRNGDIQSFLSDDSKGSYSSIPLFERGLADEALSKRTPTHEWTDRSVLQGPDEECPTADGRSIRDSQHPSYDFVLRTDSLDKIAPGNTLPASDEPVRDSLEQSFLDVESDNETELSSELSVDSPDHRDEDGFIVPRKAPAAISTLPVHPLAENPAYLRTTPSPNPPSPPITLIQALHMSPEAAYVPTLQDHQVWEKPLPPTPDTTPTTAMAPFHQYPLTLPVDPTGTKGALHNAPGVETTDHVVDVTEAPRNKFLVHLPFILAFDSDILAQQFTLVEKDALNEIDWKELIDMRWKHAEQNGINARSWVSFLRDTDARGVEVVIARFNIMVKWAVSEIVLTQDMEERARCIIKFIHIAAHCRRYRNFATMSQLTIALTSNEVGRLTKTWAMVSPNDQRTLHELEALISPTRNFYSLRAEMEGGGPMGGAAASEMGCIPFVGIYTHDLLFNAQKPSEIASSPTAPPLVNFERCRTAAGIVKTLLRLIEASTLYNFQPVEGITERCLWMGALTDEEIRRHGEGLE